MTLSGWLHLAFFGLVIPVAAWRTKRILAELDVLPDRSPHFLVLIAQLVLFGGFSLLVARLSGIDLFPPRLPSVRDWLAGALMLAGTIVVLRPWWRRAVLEQKRILHLFMPRNATERWLWVGTSAVAAVSEEITWRGVQFALVWTVTGSALAAGAVCAVLFGLAHLAQGWRSAAAIVVFAGAFHGLVWITGSLYVAMAVHFLYDLIAGLEYARLGRVLGHPAMRDATP